MRTLLIFAQIYMLIYKNMMRLWSPACKWSVKHPLTASP